VRREGAWALGGCSALLAVPLAHGARHPCRREASCASCSRAPGAGIRVNAIAPGGIATPGTGGVDEEQMNAFAQLIPMGRIGDPDEIGRAALFLASDLSSYMTGAQIVVDGGRLLE